MCAQHGTFKKPNTPKPGTRIGMNIIDARGMQRTLPKDPQEVQRMIAGVERKIRATKKTQIPPSIPKRLVIELLTQAGFRLSHPPNQYFHQRFGTFSVPKGPGDQHVEIAHDPTFKRVINHRSDIRNALKKFANRKKRNTK